MITIDSTNGAPPYEQIRLAVVRDIDTGELHPGDRLPTVRKLAADLGLSPNTVARAYHELEQDRIVETRGRNGTVVATKDHSPHGARAAAHAYIEQLLGAGLTLDEGVRLLHETYANVAR